MMKDSCLSMKLPIGGKLLLGVGDFTYEMEPINLIIAIEIRTEEFNHNAICAMANFA